MIKIGQIGIGHNHGAAKMTALRKFPELFDVVGYAEESEKWIEKRSSLPAYEGLPRLTVDEILERCDAVLVEPDVNDLTSVAQRCIDAGKHVLMDKPASGTLSEFKHLLDTAKEKGLVVQLGYMYRYNPAIQKCIEWFDQGKFGDIYSINAEMSACDPESYKKWLKQFPGAGMYIFGSHMLDLVIRFLGEPKKVSTFYKHTGKDSMDFPDNCLAVLEYPKALARIYNSAVEVNGYGRRQFVICGSKGTASILPMERPTVMTWSDTDICTHHHKSLYVPIEVQDLTAQERYDEEVHCFHDYVLGIRENPWTYEHDYLVQKVLMEMVKDYYGKNSD